MRSRRRDVRRAWAAMGRDAEARRLVQLAAACGAALLRASGHEGAAAMERLLGACLDIEDGVAPRRAKP